MKLLLVGHDERYAAEQLQLSLFPEEKMEPVTEPFSGDGAVVSLSRGQTWVTATTRITKNGTTVSASKRMKAADETVRLRRRIIQQSFYLAAVQLLPEQPSWGALAGVRPTKLTTKHLLDGGTPASADKMLRDIYYVTPERRRLAVDCSKATVDAAKLLAPTDISLYIGIPFCPTRCAYCSFVSRSIGKRTELIEPYLQVLLEETRRTGKLLEKSGCRVRTIYMGGGTPTTLSTPQMIRLLDTVRESFDLSGCLEFTVEGGRPDTLDPEKLCAIRQHGADRMSINPQTMVDSVLAACGRSHRSDDILRAYQQAVDAGFKAINMDLIAGLPTDTVEGFQSSLDTVVGLNPANITVHTLALKKGADLFEQRVDLPSARDVSRMVSYAGEKLRAADYSPYYLYRQKYMSGSFENVGWSRDRLDCLYNIYMMEELHTILSLGGGGMNKVNLPDGTLRRFHNPKFPEQYIEMLDSVMEQKQQLFDLMKGSV